LANDAILLPYLSLPAQLKDSLNSSVPLSRDPKQVENLISKLRLVCQAFCTGTQEQARKVLDGIFNSITTSGSQMINLRLTPLMQQLSDRQKTKAHPEKHVLRQMQCSRGTGQLLWHGEKWRSDSRRRLRRLTMEPSHSEAIQRRVLARAQRKAVVKVLNSKNSPSGLEFFFSGFMPVANYEVGVVMMKLATSGTEQC
jgi:hypothetical protein